MFCAYTRPRYQVSVYRTIGPLVFIKKVEHCRVIILSPKIFELWLSEVQKLNC